jgi:hypothetical protein
MKKLTTILALLLAASFAAAQTYDANGRQKVNVETGAVTVSDGAGALNVIVDSATLGTVTVGDGAGALNVIVDSATLGTVTVSDGAGAMNTIVDSGTLTGITNAVTVAQATAANLNATVTDGSGALNVIIDSGTTAVTASNLDVQIGGSDSLTIGTFPDNEPINVAQQGGVAVPPGPCEREVPLYAQISQTAGAQVVTGTASERVYICSIAIVTATAQNIALVDGTGTVCATSPTGLLGGSTAATGQNFAANGGWVLPQNPGAWAKTSTDADNVCLLQSSTGQVSGILTYVSVPNI